MMVLLDTVHTTAKSVQNFVSGRETRFRIRIPRHISASLPLKRYNWLESYGYMLLHDMCGGSFYKEALECCCRLSEKHFIILTKWHLIYIEDMNWQEDPKTLAVVAKEDILHARKSDDAILLLLMPAVGTFKPRGQAFLAESAQLSMRVLRLPFQNMAAAEHLTRVLERGHLHQVKSQRLSSWQSFINW